MPSALGELDEALASGTRALEIARHLRDMRLRILTTTYLEQVHYFRGEYERVVELSTDNITVLPANWVYEFLGNAAPASVYDRGWRIMSRAQLGRFAEAAEDIASVIQFAEAMHHLFTMGLAYRGAATFHILKGDWAKACCSYRARIGGSPDREYRPLTAFVGCPHRMDFGAARQGERGTALAPRRPATSPVRSERPLRPSWLGVRAAESHLSAARPARRGAVFGDRAVESFVGQPGFAAHAQHLLGDIATHPDWFDAERGGPLSASARTRRAMQRAHSLPTATAASAHCTPRLNGTGSSCRALRGCRSLPCHGDDLLAPRRLRALAQVKAR